LAPLAKAKGLSLAIDAPEREVVVMADNRALHQIILNLASNAVKYTERGEVRLRVRKSGTDVVIDVIDTGIGIPTEDREKLFKAFSRIDGPINRRVEGSGLGLHLSQKLAGLIGGVITVESEPGKGSTFTLTLGNQG
ncbi:MAG TPA: ATP-binding protein, partial [Bauldia sp.]|nr:ATP-binding protein [Bauldia sp.]